jgi:hypothetical protein
VAGVEAEADARVADLVPQPGDGVEVAGHGVVAAGRVLEVDRHLGLDGVDALAPTVEPGAGLVVRGDVAPVDDDGPGPDLGSRVAGLLEDLARRDADLVVGRGQVDQVGRVDVDRGGRGPEGVGILPGLGLAPALGVAEEDLDDVGVLGGGGGERVVRRHVGSDEHASRLRVGLAAAHQYPARVFAWPGTR